MRLVDILMTSQALLPLQLRPLVLPDIFIFLIRLVTFGTVKSLMRALDLKFCVSIVIEL
jgi:hypothetical protein